MAWMRSLPASMPAGAFASPERRLAVLRGAWAQAVGARLAALTEPSHVQGNMLVVRVPDDRWRRALHRLSRVVLARLHRAAGSLAPQRLGFTLGGPRPPARH